MQKILIGTNCELYPIRDNEYHRALKEVYGEYNPHDKSFLLSVRTDPKFHEYFIERDMILYREEVTYIDGEVELVEYKVKIVEIPDDVKWEIKVYECTIGEYIEEVHREWR